MLTTVFQSLALFSLLTAMAVMHSTGYAPDEFGRHGMTALQWLMMVAILNLAIVIVLAVLT